MKTTKAVDRFGQSGVSMMETMLVMPIMLLIGFGIVHAGLVYQAQANLEYAALMAARVGAASSIDVTAMRTEAEYRMRATTGVDGSDLDAVSKEFENIRITVLNPSREMFDTCGERPINTNDCVNDNNCEIPYFGQQFYIRGNECAGASIQDANILRIRVSYTYNSRIPFLNNIRFIGEPGREEEEGIDITAIATVRMQTPARLTLANQDNIISTE
ncbi:MAG: hypothetical protein CMK89_09405 [Pseudomonadales bacterium]|jgi:hypothetical protein|nr:hypothetical protein [Pseudomonadales bacterium]